MSPAAPVRSEGRILTTHVGSLPRTERLIELLRAQDSGEPVDADDLDDAIEESTRNVIRRQAETGIDVGNSGEQPRTGFNIYVQDRLSGFGGEGTARRWADLQEFPGYASRAFETVQAEVRRLPKAVEPVEYVDDEPVRRELDLFDRLLESAGAGFEETFMTAVSPGQVAATFPNDCYDGYPEYVLDVAEAMRTEYEIVGDSDHLLQIDAPDLLGEGHRTFQDYSTEEFREIVRTEVEAINRGVGNVPAERVRLHACWGNYEGPHHRDVDLEEVLPILYEADVGTLSLELANPRHQHGYRAIEEYGFPDDMALMPGVIDVKTNVVEHPEVVAERVERAADAVGDPTRVIAAADCGFGTLLGWRTVDREIAWKKLESLVHGAAIASDRLF